MNWLQLQFVDWLDHLFPSMPPQPNNPEKIYQRAKNALGTNEIHGAAPNALGCAATVWNLVFEATGHRIGGQITASTTVLYNALLQSPSFHNVTLEQADAGDIIISPTGYGPSKTAHGHVGIIAHYGILSNNSENGHLEENFTKASWKAYYGGRGFPIICFRMN